MEEILSRLNASQREAVVYNEGPSLVIAGAGSGKTRVLTYKIAYLLGQGMKPWEILALTFTNKAAREMRERIAALVGHDTARRLAMGTFHSIFSRILRTEAASIGYTSNFTIYDESDSRSLIKKIVKDAGLDEKKYKPSAVHNRISMAKNNLVTAADYGHGRTVTQRDLETGMQDMGRIYAAYQERLRRANAMDFDDLLLNTHLLFRDHKDILAKYEERFGFVLVDEYQDTNHAQQSILLSLVGSHRHVCVVGDDAQSIYAFRGANIDNILGFQTHFPDSRLFKLERNYRSTKRIVQAANSLIRHNERQIPKDIYSDNSEGDKIKYKPAYSDKEEAMVVCNEIQRIRRAEGCEYGDFAVLYRTNAQSRSFEEQMPKAGIPYRIYGGMSFYQRKEIKDVIAYFRLVANPDDEEAFRRVVNYPKRGIGDKTVETVQAAAHKNGASLWEVVCNPQHYGLGLSKGTYAKLAAFRDLISSFISGLHALDAFELGKEIIEKSGITADLYSSGDIEDMARQENLQEFISGMMEFVDMRREEGSKEVYLTDFLQEVALLTDLDSDDNEQSRVSLMTVHSAKGLEFPTVFVVGLEENVFPSQMAVNSKRELEEERRLLYVAITRAKNHCILTNAKSRFRYGHFEFGSPSRFLADIDPSLMLVDEGGTSLSDSFSRPWGQKDNAFGDRRPWEGTRMQNSRPVATQFRADMMPKVTSPAKPEPAVDPFSDGFKRRIAAGGGNLRKVSEAMANGGRAVPAACSDISAEGAASGSVLVEGNTIEHQRFGVGKVLRVEGTGENTKATVEFRNAGTKQLLLKFARFKVIG